MAFIAAVVGMCAVMVLGAIIAGVSMCRDMKREASPYVFAFGLLVLTLGSATLIRLIREPRDTVEDASKPNTEIRVVIENRTDGSIETKIVERKDGTK